MRSLSSFGWQGAQLFRVQVLLLDLPQKVMYLACLVVTGLIEFCQILL